MSSQAGRAASALKSGVVYSGSAIVNGVNAITPHLAGAVDIMVVKQPDGSYKSSPFYVRFGKYASLRSLRSRDRTVYISVNGKKTGLHMHLGSYGQAYFVAEYADVSDSDDEAAFSGMMSPPSGYSSGETDAPFANPALLESVRSEVDTMKRVDEGNCDLITASVDGFLDSNVVGAENSASVEETQEIPKLGNDSLDGFGFDEKAYVAFEESERVARQTSHTSMAHQAPMEDFSAGTMELAESSSCADQQPLLQQSVREASVSDLVGIEGRESGGNIEVEHRLLPVDEKNKYPLNSLRSNHSLEFSQLEPQHFAPSTFHYSEETPDLVGEAIRRPTTPIADTGKASMPQATSSAGTTIPAPPLLTTRVARRASFQGRFKEHIPVSRTTSAPLDSTTAYDQPTKYENALQGNQLEYALSLECDISPAEGYLGDNDQPPPGSLSPTSHPEPRIGGREGLKEFQLSLCGHLLQRDMTPMEAQAVFEEYLINKDQFVECGLSVCKSPNLVCRISGTLYPWSAAAPMVLGMLAFGGTWDNLIQTSFGDFNEGSASKGEPVTRKVSAGWRLWPFWSWRGQSTTKSGDLSPIDTESAACDEGVTGIMTESCRSDSFSVHTHTQGSHKKGRKGHRVVKRKTLNPSAEQLMSLPLHDGQNVIEFQFGTSTTIKAYIYVLGWRSRMIISDIDGTVTRSDLLGHLLPPIGVDWTHSGVVQLFSDITNNGYEIMFLSSRAIAQANITRDFLHSLEQGEHKMPVGPVIISPHGLLPSLYREMILRRPHEFKIGCLQDIRMLFPDDWNPFYAGFGNRGTDLLSYERVGVPKNRIFTINSKGQIIRGSLHSVQTSTWSTLQNINELVDEVFPPLLSRWEQHVREEFSDFNHWRLSASTLNLGYDDPELRDISRKSDSKPVDREADDLYTPGHLAKSVLGD